MLTKLQVLAAVAFLALRFLDQRFQFLDGGHGGSPPVGHGVAVESEQEAAYALGRPESSQGVPKLGPDSSVPVCI